MQAGAEEKQIDSNTAPSRDSSETEFSSTEIEFSDTSSEASPAVLATAPVPQVSQNANDYPDSATASDADGNGNLNDSTSTTSAELLAATSNQVSWQETPYDKVRDKLWCFFNEFAETRPEEMTHSFMSGKAFLQNPLYGWALNLPAPALKVPKEKEAQLFELLEEATQQGMSLPLCEIGSEIYKHADDIDILVNESFNDEEWKTMVGDSDSANIAELEKKKIRELLLLKAKFLKGVWKGQSKFQNRESCQVILIINQY